MRKLVFIAALFSLSSSAGTRQPPTIILRTEPVREQRTRAGYEVKSDTFANDEMRVRLPSVARASVTVVQNRARETPATSLFRALFTAEASRANFALSVGARLEPAMEGRYGGAFLADMFGALGVRSVAFGRRLVYPAPLRDHLNFPDLAARGVEVWSGASYPMLGKTIAERLGVEQQALPPRPNRRAQALWSVPANPAGKRIVLVQTKRVAGSEQFHEDLLEMLHAVWEAKRQGAAEVTVVSPYLAYSRSDRADTPGTAVGAALLPQLMKAAGVDNVVFYSVHQAQEVGIFQALHIGVAHASGEAILARHIAQEFLRSGENKALLRVVAPDAGAAKRARVFAAALEKELALKPGTIEVVVASKYRDDASGKLELTFDANVQGATAIALDDETASGSTLALVADAARAKGAAQVYAAVSHLTGPAHVKLEKTASLSKLFVLDTLPQPSMVTDSTKIEVVGIAEPLADLVRAMFSGQGLEKHLFYEYP